VAEHQAALSVIGLRILFDLASTQPAARLAQQLAYRRLALRAVVANALAGLIGVGIALSGAPLAGLIVYQVCQSALGFAFTASARGAFATPRLHPQARGLLREGWTASAVRLVSASNNYLDQIVIGSVIGSLLLAFFNLAKRVETVFITAASAFSQVLFQPLFAAILPAERSRALRRSLALLTMLCGLPTAVLAVNATLAVTTVFGAQWAPAAATTAILAASGLARAIGGVHGALLSVSGRNRQLLAIATISAVLSVAVVLPAAALGIVWCAAALAAKNAGFAAAEAWMTRRDLPGLATVYTLEVGVPLALMLAGATAGRILAETMTGGGLAFDLARLAISGLIAAAVAGIYLAVLHRHQILAAWAARPREVAT
jgi:PST family polysaccharide transporter